MPQEMNVLRCSSCEMYQVHIVKKSNKWQCKICGKKHPIQVVYFQGDGIDCRHRVQHLNSLKAGKDGRQSFTLSTIDGYGLDCTADEYDENDDVDRCHCPKRLKRSNGKWSVYPESSDEHGCNVAPSDKENFGNPENSEFTDSRRKLRHCAKQSYSCPVIQNCASGSGFQHAASGTEACGAKSRSYPLSSRSLNAFDKWIEDPNRGTEDQNASRKNDFASVATSSSGKKPTGKWDKYLDVGKEERDTVCEDDSSSTATTSSDKKASDEWDGREDNEMEEPYSSSENDYSSSATSPLTMKVDEFLGEPKDERESSNDFEDGRDEAPINNSTAASRQSTKCNIFEDYNDDLDLTIDI